MNDEEARAVVAAALREIAPEAPLDGLAGDADLHDELGLDSMDVLNLALALEERTGVGIPERDYPQLATLDGCVRCLLMTPRRAV